MFLLILQIVTLAAQVYCSRAKSQFNDAIQYGTNWQRDEVKPRCNPNPRSDLTSRLPACKKVDGGWSEWLKWEKCSRTCGGDGVQFRERLCDNPQVQYGGVPCMGAHWMARGCNVQQCPINGLWSHWGRWTTCTKPCNGGQQKRKRHCNKPKPQFRGEKCPGRRQEKRTCNTHECFVNGNWGNWSQWSACTKSCDIGTQVRTRLCDSPAPKHGGTMCGTEDREQRVCNSRPCAIDGAWGQWNAWSVCSKTCGRGVSFRSRECNAPSPQNNGSFCHGNSHRTASCNPYACAVQVCWNTTNEADVVFVLDSSNSIWGPDFEKQLRFVRDIVDLFDVSPPKTRIGVILYADRPYIQFYLNTYKTKAHVKQAIRSIRRRFGGTHTADALNYMTDSMFSEVHGSRRNAVKIGIVITDGRSSNGRKETTKQARRAHRRGIHVFSIGVGKRLDATELYNMASQPRRDFVFRVGSYSALNHLKAMLATRLICEERFL